MDQPRLIAALGSEPIRTIGREELSEKLDRGDDFKLIMALNRWAFDAKHIPGSIHFDTPDELYAAVKPDDEVVVYCSQVDCLASVALYRDLVRRGYATSAATPAGCSSGRTPACRSKGVRRGMSTPRRDAEAPTPRTPYPPRSRPGASGWYELVDLVGSLTPAECLEPGYYRDPDWTVRDVVAHIGTWLAEAQAQFERISAGTYEGHDVDVDALNAALLQAWTVSRGRSRGSRRKPPGPDGRAWYALREPSDEATWWIRKAAAEHMAEHLDRLRDWTAELIARRP